jgi:hypothetical protein
LDLSPVSGIRFCERMKSSNLRPAKCFSPRGLTATAVTAQVRMNVPIASAISPPGRPVRDDLGVDRRRAVANGDAGVVEEQQHEQPGQCSADELEDDLGSGFPGADLADRQHRHGDRRIEVGAQEGPRGHVCSSPSALSPRPCLLGSEAT